MKALQINCSHDGCGWTYTSHSPSTAPLLAAFTEHIDGHRELETPPPASPYLDDFYRECIPHRISSPDGARMADGPTARWADLETRRAAWALTLEVAPREVGPRQMGVA